jgi:ABC-type antimicrobial peptide transport system permease subunit
MRMALGAAPRDIMKLILKQALLLTLTGGAIVLLAAFAVTRMMAGLLFGITPKDPLTFVQVAIVLIVVAIAASFIPALRATRVDPMLALRHD